MKHPEWSYDAVIYEFNIRQATTEGTLRAATERLAALRELGIDIIWLMPIYPIGREERKGELGSYYSIRDYCAVNEEFGTMEDFDSFVEEAHRLGMRVLLDWVANHTARDARWITERPLDWYERDADGRAIVPWDWSDTAKLNYANREVWQGQIDAMRFWMEHHAVDGFRCDMAMLVPIEFWQEVRAQLQQINPDLFLLAEAEEDNLFERAFDSCYAWQMHHAMCDVAQGKSRVWALRDVIYSDEQRFPAWAMRMTFTSNHDENSWSGSEFARFGNALEAMSALTFLLPHSIPLIYTGQEFGYDHSFLFFDKDPMPKIAPNRYTDFYRTMCRMKHSYNALRAGERGGEWIEINNNAPDCLMTFTRESAEECIVGIFNLSPYCVFRDFHTGIYAGEYTDVLSGERTTLYEHEWGDVEPWSYRILARHKK